MGLVGNVERVAPCTELEAGVHLIASSSERKGGVVWKIYGRCRSGDKVATGKSRARQGGGGRGLWDIGINWTRNGSGLGTGDTHGCQRR